MSSNPTPATPEENTTRAIHWGDLASALAAIKESHPWAHNVLGSHVDMLLNTSPTPVGDRYDGFLHECALSCKTCGATSFPCKCSTPVSRLDEMADPQTHAELQDALDRIGAPDDEEQVVFWLYRRLAAAEREVTTLHEQIARRMHDIAIRDAHVDALQSQLSAAQEDSKQWKDRFERAVREPRGWYVEVEEGAACIAYFGGLWVTNGQSSIEECFDDAIVMVWGEGGVMRPEFEKQWEEFRRRHE